MRKMLAITALALSLAATLATAQGGPAPAPAPEPVQPQVQIQMQMPSSGKSVSGRVSAPTNASASTANPVTSAASSAEPATTAPSSTTEPAVEAPTAPAPTSAAVEPPQPTEWERMQEVMEPIVRNPLVGVGALLALMLLLAMLAYRRNQRNDALVLSSPQWVSDEAAAQAPIDPLLPTRGLQAEILALDLELGAADAPAFVPPSSTANAAFEPLPQVTPTAPTVPSAEDLSLSKLQWAQTLLAAGENELARVLLTSVAESLRNQLQQRGDSPQGPRQ